jgi:hypothetical protein
VLPVVGLESADGVTGVGRKVEEFGKGEGEGVGELDWIIAKFCKARILRFSILIGF